MLANSKSTSTTPFAGSSATKHPDTLKYANNLAATLCSQGDLDGARQLQEYVYDTTRRVLGDEHPDILKYGNNLAETLRSQGDLDGARQLQEYVYDAIRGVLGDEHRDTLMSKPTTSASLCTPRAISTVLANSKSTSTTPFVGFSATSTPTPSRQPTTSA